MKVSEQIGNVTQIVLTDFGTKWTKVHVVGQKKHKCRKRVETLELVGTFMLSLHAIDCVSKWQVSVHNQHAVVPTLALKSHAGRESYRIGPVHFLAGWRKRRQPGFTFITFTFVSSFH